MSLQNFQILDNEPIDKSIIKRDYLKIYHQQGGNINESDQNVLYIFGENNFYYQLGNSYGEFDITVRNAAGNFIDASNLRLTNNALVFCFKEGRLATTGGSDLELKKYMVRLIHSCAC